MRELILGGETGLQIMKQSPRRAMPEQTSAPVSPALPDDSIRFGLDDFRRMMAALPMCIILHDAQTKSILWANPSACQVLGFTLEELLPLKAPDMSRQSHEYRREIGRLERPGRARAWLALAFRSGDDEDSPVNVSCDRTVVPAHLKGSVTATSPTRLPSLRSLLVFVNAYDTVRSTIWWSRSSRSAGGSSPPVARP